MAKHWMIPLLSVAAFAAVVLSAPIAQAAAVGVPDSGAFVAGEGLVQKTHGWHRYCAWGPVRYHRHVPGVGNVPCGHGPGVGGRCRAWRHECADRWGWGNWQFRRCLRNHGC